MANIYPFQPYRYTPKAGSIANLVTQPYDKISPAAQARYLSLSPYNLVRLVMLEAAQRQQVPLDRISFIDALRWLRSANPSTPLSDLIVNPLRPDRLEPRVIKRRMKKYTLMKQPRHKLRKSLKRKKAAA